MNEFYLNKTQLRLIQVSNFLDKVFLLCITSSGGHMAPFHKPQLRFDGFCFYGRGKPHGSALSLPSPPPPPPTPPPPPLPYLTQLPHDFQHKLTKRSEEGPRSGCRPANYLPSARRVICWCALSRT